MNVRRISKKIGLNSGFAVAIITVLDLFKILNLEFPTPKRTNKSLN